MRNKSAVIARSVRACATLKTINYEKRWRFNRVADVALSEGRLNIYRMAGQYPLYFSNTPTRFSLHSRG